MRTTGELLSESVEAARRREESAFEAQLAVSASRFVLFGAGSLGRKVLAALRRQHLEPLAFADNNPLLAGTARDGVPVMPPVSAAAQYGADALFIVTTFLPAGGGVRSRLGELAALGCRRTTSFLPVGWKHPGVLPHFAADRPSRLLSHAAELGRVGKLWADERSREVFRRSSYGACSRISRKPWSRTLTSTSRGISFAPTRARCSWTAAHSTATRCAMHLGASPRRSRLNPIR